jgi:hypothetical protein
MTTVDFITALFYEVDEQMGAIPTHPEAHLWPREVVTLGLLHALKGVGNRPFYRWLTRDYRALFPHLPERTRLLLLNQWGWVVAWACDTANVADNTLAFTMAAFNVLVQWHGFQPYASGFVPLSMADLSL